MSTLQQIIQATQEHIQIHKTRKHIMDKTTWSIKIWRPMDYHAGDGYCAIAEYTYHPTHIRLWAHSLTNDSKENTIDDYYYANPEFPDNFIKRINHIAPENPNHSPFITPGISGLKNRSGLQ